MGCALGCGNWKLNASTQLAIYQTAHQDRQVLSELREQQRRAYQLDQRRQEQKTLDDLFLARGKDAQLGTLCLVTMGKPCPVHTLCGRLREAFIGTFLPSL